VWRRCAEHVAEEKRFLALADGSRTRAHIQSLLHLSDAEFRRLQVRLQRRGAKLKFRDPKLAYWRARAASQMLHRPRGDCPVLASMPPFCAVCVPRALSRREIGPWLARMLPPPSGLHWTVFDDEKFTRKYGNPSACSVDKHHVHYVMFVPICDGAAESSGSYHVNRRPVLS
jgi:hypothetical protein